MGNPGLAFDSVKLPLGIYKNKTQVAEKALYNGSVSGSASRLTKGTDELLQYTAGGHVLGFRKAEMFIASGDHALRVDFVNARPVSPREEINSSDLEKNRDVAQPLGRVSYRDLWDRVTLIYEKHGSGVVKSTYHVQPAGTGNLNPVELIRLRYNVPVKVDEGGNLLLSFATGDMRETRPVAWQEIKAKRVPVEVTYRLIEEQEVEFKVGSYDPRYPLVIDPVLSWNTFLGSSSDDVGYAIAVDKSGNVYVAGLSYVTWGSPVRPFAGSYDAFAAKLNRSGALQWNTFLGGSLNDYAEAIAVDTSGNVYVTGYSGATWGSPVHPFSGAYDAFAAKLNGSGVLQWNTFLGQSLNDYGYGIAVDTSGNVYVAGSSAASWGSPIRPFSAGSYDAFAAKLNGSGALQWNTFLGWADEDYGRGIAVDTSGNVFVTGYNGATWGSPVRPFSGGATDAFVAKLNGSGALQWDTFLGGSDEDLGFGIAVDTSGNVYVAGYSWGPWGSPVCPFAGSADAFAAKLNNSGALQWNTFLGSSSTEYCFAMAADKGGNVYVVGDSYATWGSPVRPYVGGFDAFVAKIGSGVKTDFNQDGYEDILWRYYGSGGKNAVWYMRGTTYIGSTFLTAVTDLNWQIVGTGDFNGDGWPDILWRYNGFGGKNALWYMKGASKIGYADLPAAADLNWKIVGTGDFNRDGWPDILWRNYVSGYNAVWYMKGATYLGAAFLPAVTDLNWKIENH